MILSVTISDDIIREAHEQGLSIEDYVDRLIDRGRQVVKTQKGPDQPAAAAAGGDLDSAIERIRALRSKTALPVR